MLDRGWFSLHKLEHQTHRNVQNQEVEWSKHLGSVQELRRVHGLGRVARTSAVEEDFNARITRARCGRRTLDTADSGILLVAVAIHAPEREDALRELAARGLELGARHAHVLLHHPLCLLVFELVLAIFWVGTLWVALESS